MVVLSLLRKRTRKAKWRGLSPSSKKNEKRGRAFQQKGSAAAARGRENSGMTAFFVRNGEKPGGAARKISLLYWMAPNLQALTPSKEKKKGLSARDRQRVRGAFPLPMMLLQHLPPCV